MMQIHFTRRLKTVEIVVKSGGLTKGAAVLCREAFKDKALREEVIDVGYHALRLHRTDRLAAEALCGESYVRSL